MTTPKTAITPTQVAHPRRATFRTAVAAAVAALPLLPLVVAELGLSGIPWVAAFVGFTAGITRVLALPGVISWVQRYAPALAPVPTSTITDHAPDASS